jgi:hypothetical protein
MFPDFRLMIAAVLGSVVALMCGFAVFAALRINHEPLARLPSATTPLQLIVGSAAPVPLAIAAAPPAALSVIEAPIRNDGARIALASPAPAVVPEPHAIEPEPAAAQASEPHTAEGEPPAEPPALSAALAADTNERAAEAPGWEPDPAPAGSTTPSKPLSPQDQPQQASLPDEEHDAKRTGGFAAFAEVSAVPDTAAAQALPAATATHESAAKHSGSEATSATAHERARQVQEKKRARVAAKTRHVRRPRSTAVADADAQTGVASQFTTAASPQFQTAPQPAEAAPRTRVERHVKAASRRAVRNRSAVGGPYISPPQQ